MQYKVVKLDSRYAYHTRFKFMLEFVQSRQNGTSVRDYDRAMRWFHDHYGWAQEADVMWTMQYTHQSNPVAYSAEDINPVWSYCARKDVYRIYIEEEKVLEWFLLSHPRT